MTEPESPHVVIVGRAGFLLVRALEILQPVTVEAEEAVREIKRKTPRPPKEHNPYGIWINPAWVVRRMVEVEKWGVSDAVREVVSRFKLTQDAAFAGIRAAYYEVRKRPWGEEP